MFVLAHLSDPHLAPLPSPQSARTAVQARARLHQLAAQAPLDPSRRYAGGAGRRSQRPRARPHRGDRRSVNLSLTNEFAPALRLARRPGRSARRHVRARQSRLLCESGRRTCADAPLGRLHARRQRRELSVRAAARAAGADRPVDVAADAAARRDRDTCMATRSPVSARCWRNSSASRRSASS